MKCEIQVQFVLNGRIARGTIKGLSDYESGTNRRFLMGEARIDSAPDFLTKGFFVAAIAAKDPVKAQSLLEKTQYVLQETGVWIQIEDYKRQAF